MAVVLLLFDFLYDPDMTGWLFIKLLSWFVEGGEGRHSGELFCLLHTKNYAVTSWAKFQTGLARYLTDLVVDILPIKRAIS